MNGTEGTLHFKYVPKEQKETNTKKNDEIKEESYLKLVSAIFYQIFIFHQMIALQKLQKIFFISSKKLFSLLRYLNFCIFVFPSFPC